MPRFLWSNPARCREPARTRPTLTLRMLTPRASPRPRS
jgi:hypothetical protein